MRISLILFCTLLCSPAYSMSGKLKRCYKQIVREKSKVSEIVKEIGIDYKREIPVPINILISYFYYQGKHEGLKLACDILKKRKRKNLAPFMIGYRNPGLGILYDG